VQLGIASYTYTWAIGVSGRRPETPMTAVGLVDRAAELGVRRVQIADNLPLDDLGPVEIDGLERRARERGVAVEVGTRGIDPPHLLRHLALAQRFGSPILRVVVDRGAHHPSPDEVVGILKEIVGAFERAGVTIAIENHDRFTARSIVGIIERIGSARVGVCLDTVNSFGALEGPAVVVDVLGPFTVNLHVKDFAVVRASHMMGFSVEGRPAGQGQLDVAWLLAALRARGRDPSAILELWTPPDPTLAETIAKEDRWARESVAFLRRHIAD
jgi:3-oxoisoapionate decarboxylase